MPLDRITPFIFLAADVHRLVGITDQVDEVFQRLILFIKAQAVVFELWLHLQNGGIYIAVAFRNGLNKLLINARCSLKPQEINHKAPKTAAAKKQNFFIG